MASSSNPYEHYGTSGIEQDLIDPDDGTLPLLITYLLIGGGLS